MFFLSPPTDAEIARILSKVSERPYNYEHVGATEERLRVAPRGYRLSSYGTTLGIGEAVFETACAFLADFGNYPSSFTRVVSRTISIEEGTVFGTLAMHFGFASLHPCRIIRIIRAESPRRFGFALGTLPGHIGAGEERFLLTLDDSGHGRGEEADKGLGEGRDYRPDHARGGLVRYDVQAISRPDGLIGRLGTPFFRIFQKRFERETLATMREHCGAVAVQGIRRLNGSSATSRIDERGARDA